MESDDPASANEQAIKLPSRTMFKYWGFISYAREDEAAAEWLHRSLERYRIPRRLVGRETPEGKVPRRLYPLYRDQEEIPASSDLGLTIRNALRDSRSLFVVCSPMAVASNWVNEEIRTFKQFGREQRIFGLIASGEPNSSSGSEHENECFPIALRFGVGVDGQVDEARPVEPIAADIRKGRDLRANAKLRLIAGAIGVSFDELKQRDRRRRRFLFASWSLAAVALLITFISVWSSQQQRISEQTKQAESERLAGQAELSRNENPTQLERSALLAIESMRLEHSIGNDSVLRTAVKLIPKKVSNVRFEGPVPTVTFSPDGRYVAAGSQDHTVRVFEAVGGKEVLRLKFQGPVNAVAFSPDGRYVAAGIGLPGLTFRYPGGAIVFETVGGHEVSRLAVPDAIESVAFSPDGRFVAVGSFSNTVRVFEALGGKKVSDLQADGPRSNQRLDIQAPVSPVAFSPDGRYVAAGAPDYTARVFEAVGGKEVSRLEFQGPVDSVAFGPDGRFVAVGSWDKTARVFEAVGGKEVSRLEFQGPVDSVAFSPDGLYVAGVSWDKTARVFEAVGGREVARLQFQGRVNVVVFSPDGRYVAAGSYDNTARVFEALGGKEVTLVEFEGPVTSMAFSPNGHYVGAAIGVSRVGSGGAAIVFGAVGDEEALRLKFQHVVSVAFSPKWRYVAAGSGYSEGFGAPSTGAIEVFEAVSGNKVSRLECPGPVASVAFSHDVRYVAAGIGASGFGSEGATIVFEALGGKEVSRLKFQGVDVTSVAFSPDGSYVAAGGGDSSFLGTGALIVFEAVTGREVWRQKFQHMVVRSVAFSPDGRYVAAAGGYPVGRTGAISIFDTAEKKEVSRLEFQSPAVEAVAFSSDGRYVAAASWDNTARVFESVGGKELSRLEFRSPAVAVAFSPDGHYVAAASRDNRARVFEAVGGKEWSRLEFEGAVRSMSFSADRRYLATAVVPTEGELVLRLDPLRPRDLIEDVCSRLTKNLGQEEWNRFLPDEKYRKTCTNLP